MHKTLHLVGGGGRNIKSKKKKKKKILRKTKGKGDKELHDSSLKRQSTVPFFDDSLLEEDPDEYFFYHSAHGNLDFENPLIQKKRGDQMKYLRLNIDKIHPDKMITILIKTNSIMGSTTLSSQTTLTGDFGLDFVVKEKKFKDYLKIVIHNLEIVKIDIFDPSSKKKDRWVTFYDINDDKITDLPNVLFSYDSEEKATFNCGFLQLIKVFSDKDDIQSEYVFNNISKTPSGENDWIPGPG